MTILCWFTKLFLLPFSHQLWGNLTLHLLCSQVSNLMSWRLWMMYFKVHIWPNTQLLVTWTISLINTMTSLYSWKRKSNCNDQIKVWEQLGKSNSFWLIWGLYKSYAIRFWRKWLWNWETCFYLFVSLFSMNPVCCSKL